MKRIYYIFSNGRLARQANTVYLHQYAEEREDDDAQSLQEAATQNGCVLENLSDEFEDGAATLDECLPDVPLNDVRVLADALHEETPRAVLTKKPIPIEDVEAFYIFGEMDFNTKLLNFLAKHRVPAHFFNYFGFYTGTFMPRQEVNSGFSLVQQVEHYSVQAKRVKLARSLVDGASFNILKNLRYYGAASRGRDMTPFITAIEAERAKLPAAHDVATVMGLEGAIRAVYYQAWPSIFSPSWVQFQKRVKRPPNNPVNALISFSNGLCYTLALGEIYRTALSPLISFLHEPGERRYSLSLDITEIFKPILCDRLIFKLVNNGELRPEHFDEKLNFCYLKDNGRKVLLAAWDERLKQTIEHRKLGRPVSYRRLMRLECYKLQKHLLGIEKYEPFKIWW